MKYVIPNAEKRSADLLWICRQDRGFRPRTAIVLWQAMVRPILEYASEVWAGQISKTDADAAERVQMAFLRGTLGLHEKGSGVSDAVVRAETGCEQLSSRWDKLQLGYWRRVFMAPRNRLLRHFVDFRCSERDYVVKEVPNGGRGYGGWIRAVHANLHRHGLDHYYNHPRDAVNYPADWWKEEIAYKAVNETYDRRRADHMAGLPSAAEYLMVKNWDLNSEDYLSIVGRLVGWVSWSLKVT